ncbi:ribbon-helix-helix protein, CopG family [Candidatus Palauibacter sp.]|uniref:ribbon-helix-helix protein, CopG family n=1 Tax=Candidatus Palauibacter sp. TaxID=3101350 RepID=UPI003B02A004
MATTTIKSTYSLDVETVRILEALASRWNVSKSEVLRRAIRTASAEETGGAGGPLAALRQLQADVMEDGVDIERWVRDVRAERRAWAMAPGTGAE